MRSFLALLLLSLLLPPAAQGAPTTFNPADTTATMSGGNLTITSIAGADSGARTIASVTTGKYYFEFAVSGVLSTDTGFGLALSTPTFAQLGNAATSGIIWYGNTGNVWLNGAGTGSNGGAMGTCTACAIAFDAAAKLIWFRPGAASNWNNSGVANPATATGGISYSSLSGAVFPVGILNSGTGRSFTANFGSATFAGTVPSGFTAAFPSVASPTLRPVRVGD